MYICGRAWMYACHYVYYPCYLYIYIYIYMLYIYIYIYIYMCVCVLFVYTHAIIHSCLDSFVHSSMRAFIYLCVCVLTHLSIRLCAQLCMHQPIHWLTYLYVPLIDSSCLFICRIKHLIVYACIRPLDDWLSKVVYLCVLVLIHWLRYFIRLCIHACIYPRTH